MWAPFVNHWNSITDEQARKREDREVQMSAAERYERDMKKQNERNKEIASSRRSGFIKDGELHW